MIVIQHCARPAAPFLSRGRGSPSIRPEDPKGGIAANIHSGEKAVDMLSTQEAGSWGLQTFPRDFAPDLRKEMRNIFDLTGKMINLALLTSETEAALRREIKIMEQIDFEYALLSI